jgi:hypothetical protein
MQGTNKFCALFPKQAKIPQQNGSASHCVAAEFIARQPLEDPLEQISELCLAEEKNKSTLLVRVYPSYTVCVL